MGWRRCRVGACETGQRYCSPRVPGLSSPLGGHWLAGTWTGALRPVPRRLSWGCGGVEEWQGQAFLPLCLLEWGRGSMGSEQIAPLAPRSEITASGDPWQGQDRGSPPHCPP